ncbi:hypothetical protein ABW19_dt0203356 [Dactylella cylindrospora]|nr:hypothetical protein ABW19_dt0203356 [Dactylella cylindrospora]
MIEVLLPTPTTYSGTLGRHHGVRLPGLQSWVKNSDIFTLPNAPMEKEATFLINVNIKMRPTDNAKTFQDAEEGAGEGSSSSAKGKQPVAKLMIPQREKFLVGFRGFDAPVGLPESPTESTISEVEPVPITPPFKRIRSQSLGEHFDGLQRSISEPQLNQVVPIVEDGTYVADGFRPGASSAQAPPAYDAIYGQVGQSIATISDPQLPTKQLHTVPSISLFNSASPPSTPVASPAVPLIHARFPEQNVNPRRIPLPVRAPSTPGLTHSNREMLRIQIRSAFAQFFKAMQFSCNDTEKCLVYSYSDSYSMKVPWNIPLERTLRQLWKQVMEYDTACDKVKPESQGKRELATYHAVAMGLISSDLSSERLCAIWDRSLAFSTPGRKEFVQGWLSFTEFVALVWMVGIATTDPSFQ